jgi:hypothetical protein
MQGLITRARWRAYNIIGNSVAVKETATGMGIEPQEGEVFSAEDVAPPCKRTLSVARI